MRRDWIWATALATMAALLPVAAGAKPNDAQHYADPRVVTCETRHQVIPSRDPVVGPNTRRHAITIGDVYFFGAKPWADQPRSELEPRPGETVPAKMPVVVPAGRPVTISLVGRSAAHASLTIGLDQNLRGLRGDAVTFHPCPPDAEVAGRRVGRYTPFTGGFRLDGPRCLRILVETESDRDRGRIAVGRRTCH